MKTYSDDPAVLNQVTIEAGLVLDADGDVVTCSWTAACPDDAVDVYDHPVLAGVPSCARHKAALGDHWRGQVPTVVD